MRFKQVALVVLIGFSLYAPAATVHASDFDVFLDTTSISHLGVFYLDFSLSDGQVASTGIADTNNVLTVSTIDLGGGTAGTVLPPIGNVSNAASIATGLTLVDGDAGGVADFTQGFTPGTYLNFRVSTTSAVDVGGVPDKFLFRLLDSGLNVMPTNDPSGQDSILSLDYTHFGLTSNDVGAFATTNSLGLAAPRVTATPEPGALALLAGLGSYGSVLAFRRRKSFRR
jgi:hypothetical protein